jgi:carbon-monoxide dehydrogenase medium subunit
LKWIEYKNPQTLDEALGLLAEHGDKARIMAGGTDLLVQLRVHARDPDLVIDGKSVPELNEITYDPKAGLTLGAAVPCYKIYDNAAVAKAYPGLIDSASLIGGIQIQSRASVGGNLCNAAPSGDAIPTLIAHSVTCKIAGPNGTREVPVEAFCTAPGRNVLKTGEMLVSLHFPPPSPGFGARYIRFIPRNEMDIAVVGAGVSVVLNNGTVTSARVALASVAPTPLYVREAGDSMAGRPPDEASVNEAGKIASDTAKPINDMRGTIEYRKHLCNVLTRRALDGAIQRAKGGVVDAH